MNNILISIMAVFGVGVISFAYQQSRSKSLLSKIKFSKSQKKRVLVEDALKYIYHCELRGEAPLPESVAGVLQIPISDTTRVLTDLLQHQLAVTNGTHWELTKNGRNYAVQIIRAHRLWERYLADKTGYPETEWHAKSEKQEHMLSQEDTAALAAELGHPRFDPHGDPIPLSSGELPVLKAHSLVEFPVTQLGKIIHLEDEPGMIFEQLVEQGFHLGSHVRVLKRTTSSIDLQLDDKYISVSLIQAANVSITAVKEDEYTPSENTEPLSHLRPGEKGRVVNISYASRGIERRRLMDLGIVPGTIIKAELVSPSGDPTAYLVRGALIALRREQTATINISRTLEPHKNENELEKSI